MAPNVESIVVQPENTFERFLRVNDVATLILLLELVRVVTSIPKLNMLSIMMPSVQLVNLVDRVNYYARRVFHYFILFLNK
jgi:hypothetical protein